MLMNRSEVPFLPSIDPLNHVRRCPTCRGSGSVARSNDLLALIPVNDTRLRQRFTFLWIFIGLFAIGLIIFILMIFLMPAQVHLFIKNPTLIDVTNGSFRNESIYRLIFTNQIQIRSRNLFPLRLFNLTTSIEHLLTSVDTNADETFRRSTYLMSYGTILINQTVRIDFKNISIAYRSCHDDFRQLLLLKLQTKLTYTDLLVGRIQSSNNVFYQHILCNHHTVSESNRP